MKWLQFTKLTEMPLLSRCKSCSDVNFCIQWWSNEIGMLTMRWEEARNDECPLFNLPVN